MLQQFLILSVQKSIKHQLFQSFQYIQISQKSSIICFRQFQINKLLSQLYNILIQSYLNITMPMECPICTNLYKLTNRIPYVIDCGHTICYQCLKQYKNNQCPICRNPIKTRNKNFALIDILQKNKEEKKLTNSVKFNHKKNIEALFKISFVGNQSVGKTSIINYIKTQQFSFNTIPTVGIDFTFIDIEISQKIYRFQLWDTAGQEQYRAIAKNHYLNSDIIVVVYSIQDYKSFQQASSYWKDSIEQISPQSKIYLIGNKLDFKRKVDYHEASQLALNMNAFHSEVSCKTGENMVQTWNSMIKFLINQKYNKKVKGQIKLQAPKSKSMLKKLKQCCGLL